jgi:dihydroorotase-like cyclic amidohydrolase
MSASFLIKDVRIFDGQEDLGIGYVHVDNGKISSVGKGQPPSASAKVISKPGHTLLPGFIDAHNHANGGNADAPRQALRFGITTFMDMHNEIPHVTKLKKLAAQEMDLSADFKTCGVAATIENGWPEPVVTAHDKSEEVCDYILVWWSRFPIGNAEMEDDEDEG